MSKSMKREGPDPVAPVTIGTVRYEAPPMAGDVGGVQNGGYITASDINSGERLWTLKVYDILYDEERERDVQDVFITSLTDLGNGQLQVRNEDGDTFLVDLAARRARTA